jgi:predicted unusual protein kinase regulating ubiquinone biosynthesis (AarF/ABC1/UbiB family)
LSLTKSAFKRSLRFASMAGGLLKEEVVRLAGGGELNLSRMKQAKAIVEELGRLKGTAMKFGQIIALEARDFLPPEVVSILETLQNQATFISESEIQAILRTELGERIHLLSNLSPEPIAAASIGQVHRATYRNQPIVLKVQYPGIQETIDSDLKILRLFVERVSPLFLKTKADYSDLFQELKEVFHNETSYLREAEMTNRYRMLASSMPFIRVPEVYSELSTDRFLALQFMKGDSVSKLLKDPRLTKELRQHYAELFIRLYTTEISVWGLVQTDPNLGNFLLDLDTKELVSLDFGATREYSKMFRDAYVSLIQAASREDRRLCLDLSIQLKILDPRESDRARDALYALLREGIQPFRKEQFNFEEDSYSEVMRRLGVELIRELKFTPPPRELIFLHRKLGGLFQIIRRLNVQMDLRPHLEFLLKGAGLTSDSE